MYVVPPEEPLLTHSNSSGRLLLLLRCSPNIISSVKTLVTPHAGKALSFYNSFFFNYHKMFWHSSHWEVGSMSLPLASGWACSWFVQKSMVKWRVKSGWSDTSVSWGWVIKGDAASMSFAGTHTLRARGRHARGKPGSGEAMCMCPSWQSCSLCLPHWTPRLCGTPTSHLSTISPVPFPNS